MGCEKIDLDDGSSGILCSRGRAPKDGVRGFCHYCRRPAELLCDFVVGYEQAGIAKMPKKCDKRICAACSNHVGPDTDHCVAHEMRGEEEAKP